MTLFQARATFRVILATALLASTLLTACSGKKDDASPGAQKNFVQDSGMAEEWAAETAKLTLPPGATWPPPPILPSAQDAQGVWRGNVYEPGYGRSAADLRWM